MTTAALTTGAKSTLAVARAAVDLMRRYSMLDGTDGTDDGHLDEEDDVRLLSESLSPNVAFFDIWGHLVVAKAASPETCPWSPRDLVLALAVAIKRNPSVTCVDFRCVSLDHATMDAIIHYVAPILHLDRLNFVPCKGLTADAAQLLVDAVPLNSAMTCIQVTRSVYEEVSRTVDRLRLLRAPTHQHVDRAPQAVAVGDHSTIAPHSDAEQLAGEGSGARTAPMTRETSDSDARWALEVLKRHEIPTRDLFDERKRRHVRAYIERLKAENIHSVRALEVQQAWDFLRRHEPTRSGAVSGRLDVAAGDMSFSSHCAASKRGRAALYGPLSDPKSVDGPLDFNEAVAVVKSHKLTLLEIITNLDTALNVAYRVRARQSESEGARLEAAIRFLAEHAGHDAEGGGSYRNPHRAQPSPDTCERSIEAKGIRMNARLARAALREAGIAEADVYEQDQMEPIEQYLNELMSRREFANASLRLRSAVSYLRQCHAKSAGGTDTTKAAPCDEDVHRWASGLVRRTFGVEDVRSVLSLSANDVDDELEHLGGTENERVRLAIEVLQHALMARPLDAVMVQRVKAML